MLDKLKDMRSLKFKERDGSEQSKLIAPSLLVVQSRGTEHTLC